MKSLVTFFASTILLVLIVIPVLADSHSDTNAEKAQPNQKMCPVMGNAINKEVFSDYNGKRIYFCCKGCIETFKKDPDQYISKSEKEGVIFEDAPIIQVVCPITGRPIDKNFHSDYKGDRIYFCCGNCKAEFDKNPAKYNDSVQKALKKNKSEGKNN
jgi:YHS domain-containing protein